MDKAHDVSDAAAHRESTLAKLRSGAPPESLGPALVIAAGHGDGMLVHQLLKSGVPSNSRADDLCALSAAVRSGDAATVQELLENGADPNRQDARGRSPLHFAAEEGKVEIVTLVVAAGSDPRVLDRTGRSARDFARTDAAAQMLDKLGAPARDLAAARGLELDPEVACEVILAQAPQTDTLRAFGGLLQARGWAPDVYGRELPLAEVTYIVYQLSGHAWTVIQAVGGQPGANDLTARLAQQLSAMVGSATLFYASPGKESHLAYDYFVDGLPRDRFVGGAKEEGETTFHFRSGTRPATALQRGTPPFVTVDAFLKQHDIFLPDWRELAQASTGEPLLFRRVALPPAAIQRADLVYVR